MRDLSELNINHYGRPILRHSPSDKEIEAFESHFDLRLPPDYVTFLKQTNGGYPEVASFRPRGAEEDTLWSINYFYHLSSEMEDVAGLWYITGAWQRVVGKKIVPIANDGGGNQILIDYAAPNICDIKICIHDDNFRFLYSSNSFSDLLDMLVVDPDVI